MAPNRSRTAQIVASILLLCVSLYIRTASSAESAKQALPHGCNESICGSVVSKCLLTQSCKCGPDPVRNNITCARDCFFCLESLYTDCCSCVDVCRKEPVGTFSLGQNSNVENLPEPMPELFEMLMDNVAASEGRWTTLTFPAHHTVIGLNKDLHFARIRPQPTSNDGSAVPGSPSPMDINPTYDSNSKSDDVNCTVAFMKPCLSLNKCREDCMSLGAASYRWFHDGCCECVGSTCLNYGLHEGRCQACPLSKELLQHPDLDWDTADEEIVIQDPYNSRPSAPPVQVDVIEEPKVVEMELVAAPITTSTLTSQISPDSMPVPRQPSSDTLAGLTPPNSVSSSSVSSPEVQPFDAKLLEGGGGVSGSSSSNSAGIGGNRSRNRGTNNSLPGRRTSVVETAEPLGKLHRPDDNSLTTM